MADEMVFGIRIKGDATGVRQAVNSALAEFGKLDARLRSGMKALGSSSLMSKGPNLDQISQMTDVKDLTAVQRRGELALARRRMQEARDYYNTLGQRAALYYADVARYEDKVRALRKRAAAPGASPDLKTQLAGAEAQLANKQAIADNRYAAARKAAEKGVLNAMIQYAKTHTRVVKAELAEQAKASKSSTGSRINDVKRLATEQQRLAQNIGRDAMRGINTIMQGSGTMLNSFRMLTQGLSELSRVVTMFIAAPLGGFMLLSSKAAISFESAMTRVAKTTGFEVPENSFDDLVNGINRLDDAANATLSPLEQQFVTLRNNLREFAKTTTSTHEELAIFAEQIGQLGVTDPNAIMRMVAMIEMMATATDLSADEVAKSMGRIATAFGYDLNTEGGVRSIERLSNVINKLENTTAASAGEIIEGLLNVASVGGMLDLPVKDMAAIVAMMESMGVNADAVGNRITRFFDNIVQKSDKAAKFMKGFTSTFEKDGQTITRTYSGDEGEFMKWMTEDKVQTLQDFMTVMAQVPKEDKLAAMADWFDLVGQVGGKVGVLSGNINGVTEALKTAREEWENGTSLFEEYDKALMTTESHMKILKNNISDAAITVGDAFLPVINRLIEYAIPGIQILANAFKSLTWQSKLLVVGIPLLAVVLAPLLFIFSQLAHGVGMAFWGFQTFGTLAVRVGGVLFTFGKSLFTIFKMFRLAAGGAAIAGGTLASGLLPVIMTLVAAIAGLAAVVGLAGMALKSLASRGVDVAGWFTNLADRARNWGENLMATYAGGLLAGAANYVARAIAMIADWIASFFEAHSPPEKGPLSDIDKWGGPLFTTYLRGFKNADFGILSEVGNTVKSILEKMFDGDAGEAIGGMVIAARNALAELINVFNTTGKMSEGLLDRIVAGTGHLASDVKTLISLWLQYEQTQRRIKQLEQDRQKVDKGYQDEVARIASANLTAEEKAERIRAALYGRNRAVDAIDKQKKAEEEKGEALKEQLDWQKEFIKAQLDQADLFDKMAKALDKIGGGLDEIADKFGGLGDPTGGGDDPVETFDKITTEIEKRIETARQVVKEFLRGLRGEGPSDSLFLKMLGLDDEAIAEVQKAYDLAKKIYDFLHPSQKDQGSIGQKSGNNPFKPLLDFLIGLGGGALELFTTFVTTLSTLVGQYELVDRFSEAFGRLKTILQDVFELEINSEGLGYIIAWVSGEDIATSTGKVFTFGQAMQFLGEILGGYASLKLLQIVEDFENLAGALEKLEETRVKIHEFFDGLVDEAYQWGSDMLEEFGKGIVGYAALSLGTILGAAAQIIADYFEPHSPPPEGPLSTIDTWGGKLLELLLGGFVNGDFNPLTTVGNKIKEAVVNLFSPGDTGEGIGLASILTVVTGIFDDILTVFGEKIPALQDQWDIIQGQPITTLTGWWENFLQPIFATLWTGILTWFLVNTPLMQAQWDLFRDTFHLSFEGLFPMVATVFTGLMFNPLVVEAMKIALGQFNSKGKEFASAVGMGINDMASSVVGAMSGIVQGLVAEMEKGIVSVNRMIAALNKLNEASGGAGVFGLEGEVPGVATGGIAIKPTLAMIGEGGESEAIIPLSRLPALLRSAMPTPERSDSITVQINNPQVRSDDDIRKITREVRSTMTNTLREQNRIRGRG